MDKPLVGFTKEQWKKAIEESDIDHAVIYNSKLEFIDINDLDKPRTVDATMHLVMKDGSIVPYNSESITTKGL